MPSTLVHVALGGLVGTALLGERFSRRAVAVVLVAAALPDLDSFAVVVWPAAHRALLHTLVLPVVLAAALYWDERRGDDSALRARFGPDAHYVGAVAIVSLVVGGIGPDLFTNGVNAWWPLHDRFYSVNGRLLLSDERGIVQTFVDLTPEGPPSTTENTRYRTGVDPDPSNRRPPGRAERVFPVVVGGWQLLLVAASALVVSARSWQAGGR